MGFQAAMNSPSGLFGLPFALIVEIVGMLAAVPVLLFSLRLLGPLANAQVRKWRVQRGDVLCLIVMLLPLLVFANLPALLGETGWWQEAIGLDFCFSTFVAIVWFLGVGSATSAGIRNPRHRAAAVTLVYPIIGLGSLALLPLLAVPLADLASPAVALSARLNATLLGISAAVLLVMMTTVRLARGIASAAEPLSAPPKSRPSDFGRDDFDPWAE